LVLTVIVWGTSQSGPSTLNDILTINRYFRPLHRPRRLTACPNKQNLPVAISDFGNRPSVSIFHRRAPPHPHPLNRQTPQLSFAPRKSRSRSKTRLLRLDWVYIHFRVTSHELSCEGQLLRPRAIQQQITELHLPIGFQGGDLQSSTMSSPGDNHSLFARHYIDYVYAPGLLLIVGTLIVKKEWTPFAALIAVAFGIYNFMAFRKLPPDETLPKSMSTNLESQRSRQLLSPMSFRSSSSRRRPSSPTMSPCKPPICPPTRPRSAQYTNLAIATASSSPAPSTFSVFPSASISQLALLAPSPMALPRRLFVPTLPSLVTTSPATSTS
jgi:hypothetical protein